MSLCVGIVEDTLDYIDTMRHLLGRIPQEVEVRQVASTLEEAKGLLQNPEVSLAFLDIQLQEGTILEVLDELLRNGKKLPELVFVTAHGSFEYATKAIRFACLDFITKPVSEEALQSAVERFLEKREKRLSESRQVQFLLDLLKGNMSAPTSIGIVLPKGVIEFIELERVAYFQADGSICAVNFGGGERLLSTRHLGYYTDLLADNAEFVQISKNCLLNIHYLRRYDHRNKSAILKNGEALVVSHRFGRHLRKMLLNQGERSLLGYLKRWL